MATGSQLGGAVSGAASGAAMGASYGGYVGAIVGGVVGFVGGLFGGDDGSSARTAQAYANYNARQVINAGYVNARNISAVSQAMVNMTMANAAFGVEMNAEVSAHNAELKSFLGDYNASLLEDQARQVWEASDLDITQMDNVFSRQLGNMKVGYGKSGVMMNQDSPLVAQIDAETQHQLDVMVVQHGADLKAHKLLDAAAMSRWEGNMAAATIMFEGRMNAMSNYGNALMSAAGTTIQGNINSQMSMYNATVQGNQIGMGGNAAYATYQSQDAQAFTSGVMQGVTKVASYNWGGSSSTTATTMTDTWTKNVNNDLYNSKNMANGMFGDRPSSSWANSVYQSAYQDSLLHN